MTERQILQRCDSTVQRWKSSGRLHRYSSLDGGAVLQMLRARYGELRRVDEPMIEDVIREVNHAND